MINRKPVYLILDAINKSLAPLDMLFASREEAPPPLFIIGAPRSGTTLIYQVITQQFDVAYFTWPMGYLYGMPSVVTRILRPLLKRPPPVFTSEYGRIPGWLPPSEHANFWFRFFPRDGENGHYVVPGDFDHRRYTGLRRCISSISAIAGKPFVIKNVYLTMTAGVLAQVFPDARFVLIERDPLMVCQSLLFKRMNNRDPNAWWSVKPPSYRSWLKLPLWEQIARQVIETQRIARMDLGKYAPARYKTMPYARICREPRSVVMELTDWLAPLGYRVFPDLRIPMSYPATSQFTLPDELAAPLRQFISENDKT